MTIVDESVSKGIVLRVENGRAVFQPAGTSYEHHLDCEAYAGPIGRPVRLVISAKARKVYSMPSGGNWVAPILGTPRTIQGRVMMVDAKSIIVHAGARFVVELPTGSDTIDLNNGDIQIGSMVNVVAMPGVRLEQVLA